MIKLLDSKDSNITIAKSVQKNQDKHLIKQIEELTTLLKNRDEQISRLLSLLTSKK